jgi:predicted phosphohydrolase
MEVFGSRWQNYESRLKNNWNNVVGNGDTVIIPGDISWGLSLEEAIPDLLFLDSLNGSKIIGKGNHDFWWPTYAKLNAAFIANGIKTISVLHNNANIVENIIAAGTRGWYNEINNQPSENKADYRKIVNREAIRLRISLDDAQKKQGDSGNSDKTIVVFFHFPPVWNGYVCRELVDLLHEYNIKKCYFGHIHGNYGVDRKILFENVTFELISSDFLDFVPVPVNI